MSPEPDLRATQALFDEACSALEIGSAQGRPAIFGICGAQGSGKSTMSEILRMKLAENGINCAVLSIDDVYFTLAERQDLARSIHPLFATRGVPGTHDVALAHSVLDAAAQEGPFLLPRFDKAVDDRMPVSRWWQVDRRPDIVIFEGWCVGAAPQAEAALAEPINRLEATEDAEGIWRRHANNMLAGAYQSLFSRIDRLALLAAPSFSVVADWRFQQEEALRIASSASDAIMDRAATERFVQHYERITRHILAEMPGRASVTINFDPQRSVKSII